MTHISKRNKLYILLSSTIILFLLNIPKTEAGSTIFSSPVGGACRATWSVNTANDPYTPGQIVNMTGNASFSGSNCTGATIFSFTYSQAGSGGFGGTMSGTGGNNYSGSFGAPGTPGTYTVTFNGSSNFGNGSGSITYTVSGPTTATFTINSCPEGGSWNITSGGNTYSPPSPVTIPVDQAGQLSDVNYTPPGGYTVSLAPGTNTWTIRGGTYTFTATCSPVTPNPTVSVWANNPTLSCPATTIINWQATGADPDSCTLSWIGGNYPTDDSKTVTVNTTTTYTVTCSNSSGSGSGSATVTVTNGVCTPPPVVTVTATPQAILSGQSSLITWSSTNGATSCTPNFGWTVSNAANNSTGVSVSPGSVTTYGMTCTAPGGASGSDQTTVTVGPSAVIHVTSNNASGSWSSSPAGVSGSGSSGNYTVATDPAGTTYTLTAGAVSGFGSSITNTRDGDNTLTVISGDDETFDINYSSPFVYTLSNLPSVTVTKGSGVVFTYMDINKTYVSGSTQSVDLSITSGIPITGVGYSFSDELCSPTCPTRINFDVDPTAAEGTHHITLQGSPNAVNTAFDLIINPSPFVYVTCTPSSGTAKIGESITWTASASGGVPPYTYSWHGPGIPSTPPPATSVFNITYSTVGQKTAAADVVDSSSPAKSGTCNPPGSIQINFKPIFKEI